MTTVTFEAATLQVAIKKASRVAPSKGAAFDKASGIVLDIQDGAVVVMATNLDIFYMEWIDFTEMTGEPIKWRLPAQVFADIISSLPITSGTTVTLEQDGRYLKIQCNKMRSKLNIMDIAYYPTWYAFDPASMIAADNLGTRINQVDWAADRRGLGIIEGVHFDGHVILATNRYQLAVVDLPIPGWEHPVTVPGTILSQVLKQTGEVMIGQNENQLLLMPDEHTQIRAVIYDAQYPSLDAVRVKEIPEKVTVTKAALLELMAQALALVASERNPKIKLYIGKEEIAVYLENGDLGFIGNRLDVPGQAKHRRVEIHFTPGYLTDALNAAPSERVDIWYNPTDPFSFVKVDGGSGFNAWVMPRRHNEPISGGDS